MYSLVLRVLVCSVLFIQHSEEFRPYSFSAEFIEKINKKADTWQAGQNFPYNLSEQEFSRLVDLTQYPGANTSELEIDNSSRREATSYEVEDKDIPASFDARLKWPECPDIGKVRNQGACPSSYAFSVVPAFSDRLCISSNGKHKEPLSIEYLLSCCHACKHNDDTRVCGSGKTITAWWFLHKRGIVTGGDYGSEQGCQPLSIAPCVERQIIQDNYLCKHRSPPELRCHTRCTNEDYEVPYSQDRHRAKLCYYVDFHVESIQKEILTHGPVTAQISLYEDFLHYKSGVYKHTTGERIYQQQTAKLIGWGEENGTPYWLLVNSWGRQWGDNGTVKILRGKQECNLEFYVSAALPKGQ